MSLVTRGLGTHTMITRGLGGFLQEIILRMRRATKFKDLTRGSTVEGRKP